MKLHLWSFRQWLVIGVMIVVVALAVWFLNHTRVNVTPQTGEKLVLPPADIKIKTYSVSGKIDKIENSNIYYTAPVLYQVNGQNTFKYESKIAVVSPKTIFTKSTLSPKGLSYKFIKFSDIKIGDKIVAYYSSLPYDKIELSVDKIDLPQNY